MEVVRLSTNYYIFNRKKREEIQELTGLGRNIIPGIKQQIEDHCSKQNGAYVNTDLEMK